MLKEIIIGEQNNGQRNQRSGDTIDNYERLHYSRNTTATNDHGKKADEYGG